MKILSATLISLSFLSIVLFCAGCDKPSPKEKTEQETVSSPARSKEETSTLKLPDFRKKSDDQKKTEPSERTARKSPKKENPDSNSNTPSEEGKKNSSSQNKMEKAPSSDKGERQSGDGKKNSGGDSEGAKSNTGNKGSNDGGHKKTAPAGWTSSDITEPPSSTNLEIWNNILVPLEKLIIARQVKFSPLGAKHTSLTDLSGGKYKASGRCVVTEKSGNQIAYEFECVAVVNKYEAAIVTVKFHSQDN